MPDPIPSCFRGGATAAPLASTASGPTLTTSIYETHLGLAALSWSRTVLGLSLRADLRLSSAADGGASGVSDEEDDDPLQFRIRPWLFWKRRGSKRFHLKDHTNHRTVDFTWDLTRAKFPSGGGPEPSAGYFVAVSIDGGVILVAGDLDEEAYRKTKARSPCSPVLISRREHVVMGIERSYTTRARFGGREREISIDLKEKDGGMCLGVDGKRVLQVRRLRWKFRGSEKVEVEGGDRIQVSWDLHNWFFFPAKDEGVSVSEFGHAVFVFRFEREGCFGKKGESFGSGGEVYEGKMEGYSGKSWNWSESSSGGGGGGEKRSGKKNKNKKSLLKTSSSSSSSSASSGSSSTVMEWKSNEESELQSSDGFSLLVHAWKS